MRKVSDFLTPSRSVNLRFTKLQPLPSFNRIRTATQPTGHVSIYSIVWLRTQCTYRIIFGKWVSWQRTFYCFNVFALYIFAYILCAVNLRVRGLLRQLCKLILSDCGCIAVMRVTYQLFDLVACCFNYCWCFEEV